MARRGQAAAKAEAPKRAAYPMHTESGSGVGSSAAGARMMTARMAATMAHSGVDANGMLEDLTVANSPAGGLEEVGWKGRG